MGAIHVLFLILFVYSFAYFDRPGTCVTPFVTPHSTTTPLTDPNITYTHNIDATGYILGKSYTVTVTSPDYVVFGFLLWAQTAAGDRVGSFVAGNNQQTCDFLGISSCPGDTTLAHANPIQSNTITATWIAPIVVGNISIQFNFIVVPNSQTSPYPAYIANPSQSVIQLPGQTAPVTPGSGLSPGVQAGIALGVIFGVLLIVLLIVPIIYVRHKGDDQLIRRFTKRFGRGGQ